MPEEQQNFHTYSSTSKNDLNTRSFQPYQSFKFKSPLQFIRDRSISHIPGIVLEIRQLNQQILYVGANKPYRGFISPGVRFKIAVLWPDCI